MSGAARRVLVVDDDAAARRMLRRLLERRGYEVREQGDGRSGLEELRRDAPDIVLLDLRMPGELSGFDVAAKLKSDPATSSVPLVIVSASVQLDARTAIREIGCDAFVEKPVDFDELLATIEGLIGPRG